MKTISLLCPSRGRPEMYRAMVNSMFDTCAHRECVELLTYRDYDDKVDYGYARICMGGLGGMGYIRGHRHKIAKLYNCLATIATGDILMAVNDDCIFRTPGWDGIIRAHMPDDGIAVLYPDDLFNHQCTFPIIGREWLDATGQFISEHFDWWYSETYIADIAQRIGRLIPLPIVVEHLNPMTGKRAADDTFMRQMRDEGKHIMRDQATWSATEQERVQIADRLRRMIR